MDSTVLFNAIIRSKYFNEKKIYYLIFDHQIRSEGKYEIKQFIKIYNLANKNLFIKKLFLKDKSKGFQKYVFFNLSKKHILFCFNCSKNI